MRAVLLFAIAAVRLILVACALAACTPGGGTDAGPIVDYLDDDGGAIPRLDGGAADGGASSDGGAPVADAGAADEDADDDGDGLTNGFERAQASARFDFADGDTDGDGTSDADEDEDDDGLAAIDEMAVARRAHIGASPSPLRKDLVVELDAMEDRFVDDAALLRAAAAFDDAPVPGLDGASGVGLAFLRDETDIAATSFDGSFQQRQQTFASHGNMLDDGAAPPLPMSQMVHVIVAVERTDVVGRGGEVVEGEPGQPETSGLFLYLDVIQASFPQCLANDAGIEDDDAIVATLIHELGHVLQLGHDTDVNGGVNTFDVMSVPTSCGQARERAFGIGNAEPSLGATEAVGQPRFSQEAADLFRFDQRMSVDTATFLDVDGFEM